MKEKNKYVRNSSVSTLRTLFFPNKLGCVVLQSRLKKTDQLSTVHTTSFIRNSFIFFKKGPTIEPKIKNYLNYIKFYENEKWLSTVYL